MSEQPKSKKKPVSNTRVVGICLGVVLGMAGMSYAAVPLYELFCQVTGYGGTIQRAEQYSDEILDRKITVRFDANTSGDLNWDFKPLQREVELRIGETKQASYLAINTGMSTSSGQATFNVTPQSAGAYFNKIECFCFTETELASGDSLEMPVMFFVDPEIVNAPETRNITAITLSYTFFPLDKEEPVASATVLEDEEKGS
ncbi:cytochrome c oxidase assembly protein [Hoeflea prorocentri]|uniref:Cytochrome c oxidase assembly protein CtaG n=1 Tax=Hoeflea prorocentri TaxID=1922333 RepID=A0A9X3ZIB2_9HYPH|nr:cytochrome c oxidase assembly protein [Hoeflea prorocentri]MCY6381661.1 cytochrome c oxidase assembly protein [Hoeflea prorocentri]MDA5399461.1 cytochrome c oxidase assembly protein [Hoeflea prorocentri]